MGVLGQLLLDSHLTPEESERVDKHLDDARFTAMLRDPDSEQEEHVRPRTMRSLTAPLVNLAQKRPLVVVVDDVQYADIASLQILQHALRELRTKPVVFVLAQRTAPHRPPRPLFGAELLRHPGLIQVPLAMLGGQGVEELLAQSLDGRAAHALATEVHHLSGGNPLLVRALVHDLTSDGTVRAAPVTGAAFEQAVLSCLYRAEPAVQAVARGLAVLEESADLNTLAGLLDLDAGTVEPCLRELAAIGLVDGAAFRSPAARDAVLEDLPGEERAGLHRRCAVLLRQEGTEAAVVARHLVAADDAVDAEFVDVLWEAAVRARTADEVALGIACLQLAGRSCGNGPRRSAILAELTRLTWRLRPSAVCTPLRAMHSAFDEGWLAQQEVAMLVHSLLLQGRLGPAVDVIRKAQGAYGDQAAVDVGVQDALRTVYPALLDHLDLDMAKHHPVRPDSNDVMAMSDQNVVGRAGAALTAILTGSRAANCADTAEHILEGTRLRGCTVQALLQALQVLLYADRLEQVAHWSETLLREAGKLGIPGWQAPLSALAAQAALRQGNPADAVRHAGNALMWMPPHTWGVAIGSLRAILIAAHTAMGIRAGGRAPRPARPGQSCGRPASASNCVSRALSSTRRWAAAGLPWRTSSPAATS
ncbi:Helix-turn-helix transcriptional regulator OS=Streptomyces alboniger OX=132473 GN=CP975_31815 PE=4 SV=1 [Streptomyces alboniger]